jgi:hypothetical protein
MQYGIYIGNAPGNTEVLTTSILSILEARADQKTIRVALGVLAQGVKAPSNTTVQNCVITSAPIPEAKPDPEPVASPFDRGPTSFGSSASTDPFFNIPVEGSSAKDLGDDDDHS